MQKLKILVIVPFLKGFGGTETVVKNLNKAYQQSTNHDNYELKLISFGGTEKSDWLSGWDKVVYPFSNLRSVQIFMYVFAMPFLCLKTILVERPNAIICTNPIIWETIYFLRLLLRMNFKIYAWYHYSIEQKHISNRALHRCDHFLAISSGIAQQLERRGIRESKITVLTNPVIISQRIDYIPRSKEQRDGSKTTHFLYIGRIDFDGQKNVQELFHALAHVKGPWRLDLFGSYIERDKKALMAIAHRHGFSKNINFQGFSSDVWHSVTMADVLVLTSKYEGFPMILCEAISHGIFVVSSDCETGPKDIVQENNGRLYTPGDVSQLAKILTSISLGRLPLPDHSIISDTMEKFSQEHFIETFEKCLVRVKQY